MNEPTFDHERLDVYRLCIEYVAFSYRIAGCRGWIEYEVEYRRADYDYEGD